MSDAPRIWLTAEEFLAQDAAYRQERLQNPLKATKPFVPGPFVRTYVLNWNLKFTPRVPAALKPEVLL
jgi:hypothetical protein